eukprot:gene27377-36144_t
MHALRVSPALDLWPSCAKPPRDCSKWALTPATHPASSATDPQRVTCEPATSGKSPTTTTPQRTPNAPDGPHLQRIVVAVQGMEYDLPTPTAQVFEEAVGMATRYSTLLTRNPGKIPQPNALRTLLAKLTIQFSRAEAERMALEDARDYCITEERLNST